MQFWELARRLRKAFNKLFHLGRKWQSPTTPNGSLTQQPQQPSPWGDFGLDNLISHPTLQPSDPQGQIFYKRCKFKSLPRSWRMSHTLGQWDHTLIVNSALLQYTIHGCILHLPNRKLKVVAVFFSPTVLTIQSYVIVIVTHLDLKIVEIWRS